MTHFEELTKIESHAAAVLKVIAAMPNKPVTDRDVEFAIEFFLKLYPDSPLRQFSIEHRFIYINPEEP